MADIILQRKQCQSDKPTMGTFTYNGVTVQSLEPSRDAIVHPGHPCIPSGSYHVVVDFSHAFNRDMPHVLDVPLREGIRIHSGNWEKDSYGCIILGLSADEASVSESRLAWQPFFDWLQGKCEATIDVID